MPERSPLSRRTLLAGLPVAAVGVAGISRAPGQTGRRSEPVSLLAAGSLAHALETGLGPAVRTELRTELRTEVHGSAELARLVDAGKKDPDIVAVSDIALFESVLDPAWFAEFATNAVVLAYDPDTEAGRRLARAGSEGWYRPLLEGQVALGRTDPDLDPLGYRTLFVLDLATEHYGLDTDLREAIPSEDQIYPETVLVGQFETGGIDAAFAYRNMAIERGYEFVELPAPIDLSAPQFADRYATARYGLPGGTVEGDVVSYGATIRHQSPATVEVFEALTGGQYLTDSGFGVPDTYPRYTGNVPESVRN